jgi:hypothetical protein
MCLKMLVLPLSLSLSQSSECRCFSTSSSAKFYFFCRFCLLFYFTVYSFDEVKCKIEKVDFLNLITTHYIH